MILRRVSGEYCGEKAAASQARRTSQLLYHREAQRNTGEDRFCLRSSVLPVVKRF